VPKAGLKMTVLDIDLDIVKDGESEEQEEGFTTVSAQIKEIKEKIAAIA